MEPIRIAIVEDNHDARQSLTYILNHTPGLSCVAASARGEEAIKAFPKLKPDVLLLDVHLPGLSGIECLRQLAPILPQAQFMMLTVVEDYDTIFEALKSGATGYLVKSSSPAKIVESIRELYAGGSPISSSIARQIINSIESVKGSSNRPVTSRQTAPNSNEKRDVFYHSDLSERESEVLHWLAKGYLYKEVAAELDISIATIRTHVQRIYRKLHVRSKTEAAAKLNR